MLSLPSQNQTTNIVTMDQGMNFASMTNEEMPTLDLAFLGPSPKTMTTTSSNDDQIMAQCQYNSGMKSNSNDNRGNQDPFASFFDILPTPQQQIPQSSSAYTSASQSSANDEDSPIVKRRKQAHSQVEKERRRSISHGFQALQSVLHAGESPGKMLPKSTLLEQACETIIELRAKLEMDSTPLFRGSNNISQAVTSRQVIPVNSRDSGHGSVILSPKESKDNIVDQIYDRQGSGSVSPQMARRKASLTSSHTSKSSSRAASPIRRVSFEHDRHLLRPLEPIVHRQHYKEEGRIHPYSWSTPSSPPRVRPELTSELQSAIASVLNLVASSSSVSEGMRPSTLRGSGEEREVLEEEDHMYSGEGGYDHTRQQTNKVPTQAPNRRGSYVSVHEPYANRQEGAKKETKREVPQYALIDSIRPHQQKNYYNPST